MEALFTGMLRAAGDNAASLAVVVVFGLVMFGMRLWSERSKKKLEVDHGNREIAVIQYRAQRDELRDLLQWSTANTHTLRTENAELAKQLRDSLAFNLESQRRFLAALRKCRHVIVECCGEPDRDILIEYMDEIESELQSNLVSRFAEAFGPVCPVEKN